MFCTAKIFLKIVTLHLVIIILAFGNVESSLLFRMTGIVCKTLQPTAVNFTLCQIKAVGRDISETSVHTVFFKKPITDIKVNFHIKKRGFEHLGALVEVDVDICAFFRNKRRNPLANVGYKLLGLPKYSNINHSCPFNHDLIVDKDRFDESLIEMIPVPKGHYTVFSTWYIEKVRCFFVNIKFQLSEKTK